MGSNAEHPLKLPLFPHAIPTFLTTRPKGWMTEGATFVTYICHEHLVFEAIE